jgi:hypothetical protein
MGTSTLDLQSSRRPTLNSNFVFGMGGGPRTARKPGSVAVRSPHNSPTVHGEVTIHLNTIQGAVPVRPDAHGQSTILSASTYQGSTGRVRANVASLPGGSIGETIKP